MRVWFVGLAVMLAGCAGMFEPRPVAARLGGGALRVTMSDGRTCAADLVGTAPWSGALPDCGIARYLVTPSDGVNPLRLALEALAAAVRAGDLLSPLAAIALTDAAGRSFDFTSPVPVD